MKQSVLHQILPSWTWWMMMEIECVLHLIFQVIIWRSAPRVIHAALKRWRRSTTFKVKMSLKLWSANSAIICKLSLLLVTRSLMVCIRSLVQVSIPICFIPEIVLHLLFKWCFSLDHCLFRVPLFFQCSSFLPRCSSLLDPKGKLALYLYC